MGASIGIATLVILMLVGVPVAFSFAGMTVVLSIIYDVNVQSVMLTGWRSLDSVVLMALPLFILTGYLMGSGGLAKRLIDLVESMVGGIKGGLGGSLILASALFGAISGTASAAVVSIGSVMITPLAERVLHWVPFLSGVGVAPMTWTRISRLQLSGIFFIRVALFKISISASTAQFPRVLRERLFSSRVLENG